MKDGFTIFSGTTNPSLAWAIAAGLGVHLGACAIDRSPDGEVSVQLREPVHRREVYLVQPIGGARPEFIVASTHGLFLEGAREKLDHAAVRSVFVTDTISVKQRNWAKLRVVSSPR